MGHWVLFVTQVGKDILKGFITSGLAKKIRKTHPWFVNLAIVQALSSLVLSGVLLERDHAKQQK